MPILHTPVKPMLVTNNGPRAPSARALGEVLGRLDLLEAEIKSVRHLIVSLLGDEPGSRS
jgi:hypothetical protein